MWDLFDPALLSGLTALAALGGFVVAAPRLSPRPNRGQFPDDPLVGAPKAAPGCCEACHKGMMRRAGEVLWHTRHTTYRTKGPERQEVVKVWKRTYSCDYCETVSAVHYQTRNTGAAAVVPRAPRPVPQQAEPALAA